MKQPVALLLSAVATIMILAAVGMYGESLHAVAESGQALVYPTPTDAPEAAAPAEPVAVSEPIPAPEVTSAARAGGKLSSVPTNAPAPTPEPTDAPEPTDVPEPTATPEPDYQVSADRASEIAQSAAPKATRTGKPDLVNFQGSAAYEVVFDTGKIYIDANSGAVLFNGTTPPVPQNGPVNQEQAIQIATQYLQDAGVAVAEVAGVRSGRAQGMRLFEVTFTDGTQVYINARTAEVVAARRAGGGDD